MNEDTKLDNIQWIRRIANRGRGNLQMKTKFMAANSVFDESCRGILYANLLLFIYLLLLIGLIFYVHLLKS
jgi:hypothetical protein